MGFNGAVVIDAADTDCYVQAAYLSHCIPGDLGIKRKNGIISCSNLCSVVLAKIVIQFHCLTGNDSNNGFYGRGKRSLFEKTMKKQKFQNLLKNVGTEIPLKPPVLCEMKQYIIQVIYGDLKSVTAAECRANKWKQLKKKSTLRLCPDDDTLNHICERANYLSFLQMHPDLHNHPSPVGHGWLLENGKCRPVRHTKSAVPSRLSGVSSETALESDSDNECCSDSEYDSSDSEYECLSDLFETD